MRVELGVRHSLDTESGALACLRTLYIPSAQFLLAILLFLNNTTSSCTAMTQNCLVVPYMISAWTYWLVDGLMDWWTEKWHLGDSYQPCMFPLVCEFMLAAWRLTQNPKEGNAGCTCFSGWWYFGLAIYWSSAAQSTVFILNGNTQETCVASANFPVVLHYTFL